MQAFGIAALVFAIIGIIVPFGYFVSTVSALLAFFSSGRGTALGAASVIINIINIYMLSPTLLFTVGTARIARKTQELSGQEMLFLALILIQIAALSFIAAHWLFSSIEDNEESENTIMVKNAMKSFFILILGAVSIFSIGLAGKTAFAIKKPQKIYTSKIFTERPMITRVSAPPRSTEKSWAQHGFSKVNMEHEENFSGEPFTFDIWTAGMDEVDILKNAKRNGINLFDGGSEYRYGTRLIDEYASVRLHLTAKTRRLMSVSINWSDGRKVKAAVLEMLERQNAVSYGNVYKIDERTEIQLRSVLGINLEMTYKDLALMRADVAERRQKNEEERRHAIAKDGDRFFKKNEIAPQVQENNEELLYKITGKNGKITYTNDPAKAAAQKASPVELKPLETVRLKELTGYVIYLKDGRIIDSKAASSDGRTVRFKEGKINIGMPVEEVDDVKGLYRAGNETSAKSLDFRGGF